MSPAPTHSGLPNGDCPGCRPVIEAAVDALPGTKERRDAMLTMQQTRSQHYTLIRRAAQRRKARQRQRGETT